MSDSDNISDNPLTERRISDRRELTQLRNDLNALAVDTRQLSEKVSSMGGVLKVLVSCLIAVISLAGWIVQDVRIQVDAIDRDLSAHYELLAAKIASSDLERMRQDNSVISVLTIISLNQKRVMEELTLQYMSPEWVERQSNK